MKQTFKYQVNVGPKSTLSIDGRPPIDPWGGIDFYVSRSWPVKLPCQPAEDPLEPTGCELVWEIDPDCRRKRGVLPIVLLIYGDVPITTEAVVTFKVIETTENFDPFDETVSFGGDPTQSFEIVCEDGSNGLAVTQESRIAYDTAKITVIAHIPGEWVLTFVEQIDW